MTSPKRMRVASVLAIIAVHGAALLAWTQVWVVVTLADGPSLAASGDVAAPALPALALAGVALAGALTIAGRIFRVVLGALQALLGATVAVTTALVLADPVTAASATIGEATGLGGSQTLHALVAVAAASGWSWLAITAGGIGVLLGVIVITTARSWPESGRRYGAVSFQPVDGQTAGADDWDALSEGRDPTA